MRSKKVHRQLIRTATETRRRQGKSKIWAIYIGQRAMKNFQVGKSRGIWGFTTGRYRSSPKIGQIQKQDLVIFFGPTAVTPRMSDAHFAAVVRRDSSKKLGTIAVHKVMKNYWDASANGQRRRQSYETIWPGETSSKRQYPHRFGFDVAPIYNVKNIPFRRIPLATMHKLKRAMIATVDELEYVDLSRLVRFQPRRG